MNVLSGARSDASVVRSARMLKTVESTQTITRQDLRAAVYDCCPQLSRAEAREIFDATFDELSAAILRGESVKLRSFGTFTLREKRQRMGRNPKTGVEAVIRPRKVLTFHPSPALVARMNGWVERHREIDPCSSPLRDPQSGAAQC
jgi:integration host factor subunit alpha